MLTPQTSAPHRTASTVDASMMDAFCFATINPVGRLSLIDAPTGGAGLFPLGRRTRSGLVRRIQLDDALVCWLDADVQDGAGCDNPAATQICTHLGDHHRPGWWSMPFVCGTALFTGLDDDGHPVGLSNEQVRLLADTHATADWEL